MRELRRQLAVAGMAMLAGSCGDTPSISLAAGSSGSNLAFSLAGAAGASRVSAFRVDRCDARGSPAPESHWLTMAPDTAERVARITYASPPPGWRSVQGPQPMVPGCYRAAVANAPPLEFDVLPDGDVKARRGR